MWAAPRACYGLADPEGGDGALEFEAGERDQMEAGQNGETALVAHEQAAVAVQPGEGALNDPITGPMRRFSSAEGCGIDGEVLSCGV